jgi:hypothetical protein
VVFFASKMSLLFSALRIAQHSPFELEARSSHKKSQGIGRLRVKTLHTINQKRLAGNRQAV